MTRIAYSLLAAGIAVAAASAPVQAATVLPACAATDISSTLTKHVTASTYSPAAPTPFVLTACTGFAKGNLLNNGNKTATVAALNSLVSGFSSVADFDIGDYTKIVFPDADKQTVDFTSMLNGLTLIGVHYGSGSKSPSDIAGNTGSNKSDSTAFYLFDAGVNLDKFFLTYGAGSDVVLFSTQPALTPPLISAPVPEPASWALLIAGMGTVGAAMRRRKAAVSFA